MSDIETVEFAKSRNRIKKPRRPSFKGHFVKGALIGAALTGGANALGNRLGVGGIKRSVAAGTLAAAGLGALQGGILGGTTYQTKKLQEAARRRKRRT